MLIRWPGVIKSGTVYDQSFAYENLISTLAAATGNANIVEQCANTCQFGGKSFKVHLDGYNLIPFFKGDVNESPHKDFLYWRDEGEPFAIPVLEWKVSFIEQYHEGLYIWLKGYEKLRRPLIYSLRCDPFERGPFSSWYPDWQAHHAFLLIPARAIVAKWLETFKDYPVRQKPASFNLDEVMRKLSNPACSSQ